MDNQKNKPSEHKTEPTNNSTGGKRRGRGPGGGGGSHMWRDGDDGRR